MTLFRSRGSLFGAAVTTATRLTFLFSRKRMGLLDDYHTRIDDGGEDQGDHDDILNVHNAYRDRLTVCRTLKPQVRPRLICYQRTDISYAGHIINHE